MPILPALRLPRRPASPRGSGVQPAPPEPAAGASRQPSLVDDALDVDGVRTGQPTSLEETYELVRQRRGTAWIGVHRPTVDEITPVAREFDLHPLAVEDAILAHQRPKLERYGSILLIVLRPARYVEAEEGVEFGELHVVVGPAFVLTVPQAESPDLVSSWSARR